MYKDQRGVTDSLNNQKYFNQKYLDKDPGPFIATVKFPNDPTRMGRLGVNIPALTGTTDPSPEQIIWCQYLSPFYGVKPLQSVSKTDPYTYTASQTSYGMWAVPPDVDTTVLVIFAKGQQDRYNAFWMGCVQEPYTNAQIPGHAASPDTAMPSNGGDFSESKQDTYGTDILPTGEKNRGIEAETLDQQKFPINDRLAAQLMAQGLIADRYRGTTTSSARRESPSAVFGISTPGRIKPDSNKPNIGLNNSPVSVDRDHGHSFVMDDGARDGTNQLVRMRTASGHQLLMHDTQGVVYIANASGNAWIEMNKEGRIDVYSGVGGINMRTEGDFNLHSDTNINLHAGQSIRMSASGTDEVKYKESDVAVQKGLKTTNDVKIPKIPGQIIQSTDYHQTMGDKGVFVSSQDGVIQHYGNKGITSYSGGQQLHGAAGQIHLAGAQVHFNSTGASPDWGPTWMTTDATGMTPRLEGDVELAKKGIEPLRPFTRQTKTTVHRFVTHEPMPRFRGFSSVGALPMGGADNKKQWYKLASTPGTVEYMEYQNLLHPNANIRDGQWQVILERNLREQMGTSTDPAKARKIAADLGRNFDELFGINASKVKWDIKDSISNKFKGFDVSDDVNQVITNQTKKLADQVIDTVTGSKVAEMFKDNVFVNQAGELFALGDTSKILSGDFKGFATDAGANVVQSVADKAFNTLKTGNLSKKAIGVDKFGNTIYERSGLPTSIGGLDLSGFAGTINIGNIASIGDLKATTNVFKNVVAGQVTSTIQQTAITAVASQAKGFLQGLGGSTARELGSQGIKAGVFTNLGAKIGAIKLPTFLGGGSIGSAVSGFFGKFSDARLKEDIRFIGRSPQGINIYEFKYKHVPGTWQGVMAQEVPWASVMTDTGFYMVDYTKVDVEFRRLD
jgi:hypothetical protein